MVDIKIVIGNPKTGKTFQQEIKDDMSKSIMGKKIGDKIKGELFDLTGYEFEITGGSDKSGFPMRKDADGIGRKKILAVEGVGLKRKTSKTKKGKMSFKGIRQRKTIAGNTVGQETSQLNLKILKEGKQKLGEETIIEPQTESSETAQKPKRETKTEEKKE